MIALSEKMQKKLKKVAKVVAHEKKELYFFGLVHRANALDRWDLLVSSKRLKPWTLEALEYIAQRLKTVGKLTTEEMVSIGQIVALPQDNEVIQNLSQNGHGQVKSPRSLHPTDRFDRVCVIWPAAKEEKAA